VAGAQFFYALLCRDGVGVPENHSMAARYLRLAADQGHAEAQYFLAAEQGLRTAVPDANATEDLFTAALRLSAGEGVARNLGEAVRLYALAADKGHADA